MATRIETPCIRRARYHSSADGFSIKRPAVPAHVFMAERDRALDSAAPTGLSPLDLSGPLGLDFPPTTPLILSRYARSRARESLTTSFVASGELDHPRTMGFATSRRPDDMAMPESIPAPLIIDTYKDIFRAERNGARRKDPLGWIISVPDTHQKTVLAALDKERDVKVLTCSTEDEANGVAAGLWMAGEPVIVMIQHAGLYASVNTLRGIAIDGRVPIFYMIGLLSREADKDPLESKHSMVRWCEPLLDVFGVPHARLEGPDDVKLIPEYYRMSRARRGPAALLVGLATS
jgi:sulfopyruvate decarboxylase TPP-binding subunit